MKFKLALYTIIFLVIFSFFLKLFIINENSNSFIFLKKKLTGIYHYLGFYNLKNPPEKNTDLNIIRPEIISANNFDLEIVQLEDFNYEGRSAALLINDKNEISFYHQKGYLIKNKLLKKINLSDSFTTEKHGGLKGVFKINDEFFGFISSRSINCYKSSIISLKNNKQVFETECLPKDHLIDYNGIGGANFIYKNSLFLSIGTPETHSQEIRDLAQDDNSFYGKILKIDFQEFKYKNLNNIEKFSKGHRNPQGLINYKNLILSTEHGPWGGDEINIINKNSNYGWPVSSYGTKYSKNDNEGSNLGESFDFNHKSKNFSEPIYAFIPSEAISDLTKCPTLIINYYQKPCLLLTSLKSGSLFIVLLNDDMNSVLSIEKIPIGMRLRHFAKHENDTYFKFKDHIYVTADQEGVLRINFLNFR